MVYVILLIIFWNILLFTFYHKNNSLKLSRNFISAIHALGVVFSYITHINPSIVYYWAISYYLVDGFFEVATINRLYNIGLLVHHIVTVKVLIYLNDSYTSDVMFYAFFLSELSNIPMYIVYYLKSIKYPNKLLIKFSIFVEALSFIILRLIIGSKIAYDCYFNLNMPLPLCVASVFILGISLTWILKLVKQLIN